MGKPALVSKVPFVQETFNVVGHEKWHMGGSGSEGAENQGKGTSITVLPLGPLPEPPLLV